MRETRDVTCREALERLYEYLDGELRPEDAEAVRRHYEICRGCYPDLEFTARFRDAIRRAAAGQPVCPDELRAKVAAMLRAEGVEP